MCFLSNNFFLSSFLLHTEKYNFSKQYFDITEVIQNEEEQNKRVRCLKYKRWIIAKNQHNFNHANKIIHQLKNMIAY